MSAETSRDVTHIQDEDVLRKMWQDTEDFGQKKEIRAHMYKLREARLRDFYNTGEVTSQTKQTSTTFKESTTKGHDLSTHADSLADHSFLSLKSKEIRDSESPTRDVAYKISGAPRLSDQGWNVVSSNESSADGKSHSTTRVATTSGTEAIDGGVAQYAAKTEQKATVFRDGDDKNYVKSVGANFQNVIEQEASGGDENSKFYTSSKSTSSSSKHTSEQKSTSGDIIDPQISHRPRTVVDADFEPFTRDTQTSKRATQHHEVTSEDVDFETAPRSTTVVRKTYTTDAPNDLKKHPSYVDGSTKVITETKTLPDGSTVTTTRYETKGGKATSSSSSSSQSYSTSSKQVSSEQKSSSVSSKTDSHRSVRDSRIVGDNNNVTTIKYITPDTATRIIPAGNDDVDRTINSFTSTTSSVKVVKNQDVVHDSKTTDVKVDRGSFTDNKEIKRIEDIKLIGRDVHKNKIDTQEDVINRRNTDAIHREEITIIPSAQLIEQPVNKSTHTINKTTVIKTIGTKYDDQKVASDDFINIERETKVSPSKQAPITIEFVKSTEIPLSDFEPRNIPVDREPIKSRPDETEPTKYDTPERRKPIKPGRSELDEKPTPTDGQYDTTYRTDYTNKRISVDVSPTHDAFARSLRAVTPERDVKTGSTRSLRTTSTTSLRNSTSPEKYTDRRHPSRNSPDTSRPHSPSKKSPSGKTSPDKQSFTTVTRTNKYDSNVADTTSRKRKDDVTVNITTTRDVTDRRSPDRKPYSTDTLTRKKKITDDTSSKTTTKIETTIDSNTLTRKTSKNTKPRSRSNSPTSTASEIEYFRNTAEIVTDLDVDDTVKSIDRTTRRRTEDFRVTETRPSTLDITTTKVTKKVTDRSSTSPITSPRKQTPSPVKDGHPKFRDVPSQFDRKSPMKESESPPKYFSVSPKDEKPKDKIFKRTDTYEERCRQILGIAEQKTLDNNSTRVKTFERPKSPEKKPLTPASSPTKEAPRKPALPDAARRPSKSPEKHSSPTKIQEFPSQVRKSPEKQPAEKYPEKIKPVKTAPKIQEFPSQIRKSPEKEPLDIPADKRKQPKEAPKIKEFPSQIRKTPEKEPLEKPEEKRVAPKEPSKISEFPSHIRRSPERISLQDLPDKSSPYEDNRSPIREIPSQGRGTPEIELLDKKAKPTKVAPTINEFPSQIRKSPEREPLTKYPEKTEPATVAPTINEFPSQIRKVPEKEPLEKYPEKTKPTKVPSKINEFPSQVRRSPEKEPLQKYPEKVAPAKVSQSVNEFPSQSRRPDKKERSDIFIENERLDTDIKTSKIRTEITDEQQSKREKFRDVFDTNVTVNEQTRTTTRTSKVRRPKPNVAGSDTDSTSEEEDEPINEEDSTITEVDIIERFSPTRKSPVKDVTKPILDTQEPKKSKIKESTAATVQEFPSQIRKSPQKEPVDSHFVKQKPLVQEFPSQIRKSPQREALEPYTEKTRPSPQREREPLEPYPEISKKTRSGPKVEEFPSQMPKKPESYEVPEKTIPSDRITATRTTLLESRVPVDEAVVTKKFISSLCQDEELDRATVFTNETEQVQPIRSVPLDDASLRPNKTVKKDSPGKYGPRIPDTKEVTTNLIKKERVEADITLTNKVAPKSPVKKSPNTKSSDVPHFKRTTVVNKVQENAKFTGVSEYTDEYSTTTTTKDTKIRHTPIDRNKNKITTKVITARNQPTTRKIDVENLSDTEEDTRRKTHKTNIYTTRATKLIQNGNAPKTIVFTISQNNIKPREMPKKQDIKRTPVKETPRRPISPEKRFDESKQPKNEIPHHRRPETKITEGGKNIYNTQTRKTIAKVTEVKQIRPVTKTVQKTFEIESPKRHVVSTIINIKPKTKSESAPIRKPTTVTTTRTTKLTPKVTLTTKTIKHTNRAKPIQNGHIPSDDDSEETDDEVIQVEETHTTKTTENLRKMRTNTSQTRDKITRTVSDQIFKTPRRTPVRGTSKPELMTKPEEPSNKKSRPEKNIITTKSILIENAVADEREIIVDLKRSKSSREETPDRICPFPILTTEDSGIPRYPDHITEPEDFRHTTKPKRLSDIPLTESEDVTEFNRITEVTQDRVQDTDECLLSVNEKINIYLSSASQQDKRPKDTSRPAPKVDRGKLDVNLEDDECLLSVSDKVNKFITTAEHLTVKEVPQRPKSPKLHNVEDESRLNVTEKVSHFISTAEKVQQPTKPKEGFAPKVPRPDLTEVDESIRSDECLLSVSDKVTKFITTAEKLTTPDYKKPVNLSRLEPTDNRQPSSTECTTIETDEQMYTRRSVSPEKLSGRDSPKYSSPSRKSHESSPIRRTESPNQRTPERRPSNLYPKKTEEVAKSRRDSFEPSGTPKSSRRTSQDDTKTVLSPTGRLRSTETIRKAKALFENINKEQEILKQRDILSRPSVFEHRKTKKPDNDLFSKSKPKEVNEEGEKPRTDSKKKDVCTKLTYEDEDELVSTTKTFLHKSRVDANDSLKSTRLIMEGLKSHTSPDRITEIYRAKPRSRDSTPDGDIPHYMLPLDRTVRARSPHYENIRDIEETMTRSTGSDQYEEVDAKTTKFGVTLKRTDSGRAITTTRRKTSTASVEKQAATELDVENIYELHILETMLERVVGYDIRRRIRAQIRIVKRLIEENNLESVTKKTKTTMSPTREVPKRGTDKSPVKYTTKPHDKHSTEYQTSYTKKFGADTKPIDNRLYQHSEVVTQSGTAVERKTEYESSYAYNERRTSSELRSERRSTSPETKTFRTTSPDYKVRRSSSPESKRTPSPDKDVKIRSRLSPEKKAATRVFDTELKKTRPVSKTVVSEKPDWVLQRTLRKVSETNPAIKKVVTTTRTTTKKEVRSSSPPKHTDVITSSYGVGPMDENGSPLFGLKALRAQNKSEKTKVQGTVIRSHYYAENGQDPVGEISVTKYSTDPKDLNTENLVSEEKGLASVTTTQKFGYKGTPSLKTIGNKKKQITDIDDAVQTSSTKTSSSKVTRRGSVKEISQKFIENAVETSKSERQQSSYPKAGLILRTSSFKDTASSGGTGSSREGSPGMQEICETVTTVKTSSKSTSGKADTFLTNKSRVTGVQDVITRMKNEDIELGESQEDAEARSLLNKFIGSQVILSGMESHSGRPTSNVRTTTTKVTTTKSDGGIPKTVTRTFTHPITEELLDTVWDEQTLKLLLEQSTDYEDRRIIRARLRQVMAEQEACAELVEKASEESEKKESVAATIQEKVTTEKTFSEGPVTTSQVTSRVTSQQQVSKKPLSPFAKFKQLDKQNSLNSPPSTPKTPTGGGPLFKFTDPALSRSASTVKERLLQWCQMKTKEYENIQLDNFSTSWADGLAFCALVHHFLPDAFDYQALNPKNRRHNFTLAFRVADEKADIAPLLDVDDMVATRKPDWKCVFTYVQSIYRRFKDED